MSSRKSGKSLSAEFYGELNELLVRYGIEKPGSRPQRQAEEPAPKASRKATPRAARKASRKAQGNGGRRGTVPVTVKDGKRPITVHVESHPELGGPTTRRLYRALKVVAPKNAYALTVKAAKADGGIYVTDGYAAEVGRSGFGQ